MAAERALQDGTYDAIAFGRLFLSNPDLVERLRDGKPLNAYDVSTFYVRDPVRGYVDYPTLERAAASGVRQVEQRDIGAKAKL